MVSLNTLFAALVLHVSVACCRQPHHHTPHAPSTPVPPSQDPFYTVSSHFESKRPGWILKQRRAPGNLTSIFNCSAVHNILYRTTSAQNKASWAVTTLFAPAHVSSDSVLSYQIHYNSPNVDESPSFTLNKPDPAVLGDINAALAKGWYVNVPDYEGPNAAFGAAVGSGYATLDSIRAVRRTCFGRRKDIKNVLWGYAGGSIASEAATELQKAYAPDVHIAGAALGGLISKMTEIFETLNKSVYSGLIVLGLLGYANEYPAIMEQLNTHLHSEGPFNKTGFMSGLKMGQLQAFGAFYGQDVWSYFDNGKEFLNNKALVKAFDDNAYMGTHGTPQVPLYIYKAVHDDVTPISTTDAFVKDFCGKGVHILYERNLIGNHIEEEVNGNAKAFEWVTSALDGTLQQSGCTTRNVAINVTASAS